jgi:hypothetical protein
MELKSNAVKNKINEKLKELKDLKNKRIIL